MESSSTLVSTSIFLVTSLTTSFATVFSTSQPVTVATVTSIISEASTFRSTAIIFRSQMTWASTIAIPLTVTRTMSQPFTFTPSYSIPPPPPATVVIATATLTSTLVAPGQIFTYYPSAPSVTLSVTTTRTEWHPPTSTVTFTQVDFILESAPGYPYSTLATVLPLSPTPTDAIVLITNPGDQSFNYWSPSAKGGLIAGVILAGLLLLGMLTLLIWCFTRRRQRKTWVQSGWFGPPRRQVVLTQPANRAYWGPGRSGWGIHG